MKTNAILISVAALIVAAGAYWFFFAGTNNQPPVSATVAPSDAQLQFETLASQLPISFKTDIFSDKRFNALVDITTPITPEPAGRADPLAPIAGVSKQ